MVMDFAQNFVHKVQNEPQAAHWHRHQTTLHPFVCYYLCPTSCNNLIRDEVVMISDDRTHDSYAVETFQVQLIKHLRGKSVTVKRIIQFSDNCAAQYKSFRTFDNISQLGIAIICNFSGAKHGKGDADGVIGRLSFIVDAQVRAGNMEIYNAKSMAEFCTKSLSMPCCDEGQCQHYKRHFYYITDIAREDTTQAKTMEFTSLVHSIRNTGKPGYIETRESSCFCDVCFLGLEGKCKNSHLVKSFIRHNLYGAKQKESANFDNEFWPKDALPVNTRIKRIVRPKLAEKKNTRVDGASAKPLPSTSNCATKKSNKVKKAQRKADCDSDSDCEFEVDSPIR
jgi:hypothetical protein